MTLSSPWHLKRSFYLLTCKTRPVSSHLTACAAMPLAQLNVTLLPPSLRLKNHYMLNHPHVVQLKDVFVTNNHLNIVLELAQSGMLFEYVNICLKENGGHMKEEDARWVGCTALPALPVLPVPPVLPAAPLLPVLPLMSKLYTPE